MKGHSFSVWRSKCLHHSPLLWCSESKLNHPVQQLVISATLWTFLLFFSIKVCQNDDWAGLSGWILNRLDCAKSSVHPNCPSGTGSGRQGDQWGTYQFGLRADQQWWRGKEESAKKKKWTTVTLFTYPKPPMPLSNYHDTCFSQLTIHVQLHGNTTDKYEEDKLP